MRPAFDNAAANGETSSGAFAGVFRSVQISKIRLTSGDIPGTIIGHLNAHKLGVGSLSSDRDP
jgi:hypothetical protein